LSHMHSESFVPAESQRGATGASPTLLDGLIVDGSRGQYRVETAAGPLLCVIRGRLRKQLEYPLSQSTRKGVRKVQVRTHDPVAVGDRVRVLPTGRNAGVIEEIVARAGASFTRGDPDAGTLTSVAGLDQMVAVFAARDPEPHLRLLDRFLVVAESQEVAILICLNKVDLGVAPWLAERLAVYRRVGYDVIETSAERGTGMDALRQRLAGHTSALLGPSGVGKSSLLNTLEPGLSQRVSEVSAATSKGRHTTTGTRLVPLAGPEGGFLADTAGIRALAVSPSALARLDQCFREFRPYLGRCRLSDCTHVHEPDCAVRQALRDRALDRERYESYRRLLAGGAEQAGTDWEAFV
jgi:ribosome biogenesis GTPase / thiamine phosphate phosphatase